VDEVLLRLGHLVDYRAEHVLPEVVLRGHRAVVHQRVVVRMMLIT
jgi:hypothetical protein